MAGEVVGPLRPSADPEAAVLAAARPAVLEDDHAADGVRALDGADVVALDAQRRRGKAERVGQLLQGRQRLALRRPASGPARGPASRPRCARRAPAAGGRSPRCGTASSTRPPRRVREERRQLVGLGRLDRHQDARRHRSGRGVVLLDERATTVLVRSRRPRSRAGRRRARRSCPRGREELHGRVVGRSGRAPRGRPPRRFEAAIFWLSIVRSMARSLSRRAAARS